MQVQAVVRYRKDQSAPDYRVFIDVVHAEGDRHRVGKVATATDRDSALEVATALGLGKPRVFKTWLKSDLVFA